ncbi:hypothetical protein GJ629_00910 [Halapricum sp. CBA1109]|uniref:hypothetical protein n=1 Tax=Halapricum sp. CBA1109 TaxID=2668068 RepID=UPI0012F81F68|nr:hypothetical protein [Halapricum sp. CBA1109]MUV88626.1 hypothetical protein [Halapricum sp. CBA1109]
MDERPIQTPSSVAFTYDWYRSWLDRIEAAGYEFQTFPNGADDGEVLLRHDVDLSLASALTMARIEAERGVEATYCILLTSPLYNPLERAHRDKIRAISSMGHDIALHFSTHEYWDASENAARSSVADRVAAERDVLGTILPDPPETVSFHIPPSWVLGRTFEEFESTYRAAHFSDIEYVADSGQRWREEPPSLPSDVGPIQILTHPGLWGEDDTDFGTCVDESVSGACQHASEKATREFLDV